MDDLSRRSTADYLGSARVPLPRGSGSHTSRQSEDEHLHHFGRFRHSFDSCILEKTIAQPASAAVSMRNVLTLKQIEYQCARWARSFSRSVKPPSGPTAKITDPARNGRCESRRTSLRIRDEFHRFAVNLDQRLPT